MLQAGHLIWKFCPSRTFGKARNPLLFLAAAQAWWRPMCRAQSHDGIVVPSLTMERAAAIQEECSADDVPLLPEMCTWSESACVAYFESGGAVVPNTVEYPRVYLTSDVHTDREDNVNWLKDLDEHPGDVLILAGDVSAELKDLEMTLRICLEKFEHVFFTPGNHDLCALRHEKDRSLATPWPASSPRA